MADEKVLYVDTLNDHKERVKIFMNMLIDDLYERAITHDNSKLEKEEMEANLEASHTLLNYKFGEPGYVEARNALRNLLDLHYSRNPHHQEHYPNGFDDMNLLDLCEMFCDWSAAASKHNSTIYESIEKAEDSQITPYLRKIMYNTAKYLNLPE